MKEHQIFFSTYESIDNDQERLAFLRGYLLGLSPKEMKQFLLDNFDAGFAAYAQTLATGSEEEKIQTKLELDQAFAPLQARRSTLP